MEKLLNTNINNEQTSNCKFKQNYLLVSYEMCVLNMLRISFLNRFEIKKKEKQKIHEKIFFFSSTFYKSESTTVENIHFRSIL